MLKQKIEGDLKDAMKKGEALRVSVLRMLLGAIANKEIEFLKKEVGLSDEEVQDVLARELKKRNDSAEAFEAGGRKEMAEKEKKEAEIILEYLPEEIPDAELKRVVSESVREAGAKNAADFGKVMKLAMAVLKGKASGQRVSEEVKKQLSGNG